MINIIIIRLVLKVSVSNFAFGLNIPVLIKIFFVQFKIEILFYEFEYCVLILWSRSGTLILRGCNPAL